MIRTVARGNERKEKHFQYANNLAGSQRQVLHN